ncbi:hypothetical protein BDF20DRAFT_852683 [Mycotypha africana]|uniref:uncharacterized protein n=1 Tax=Mycotypha africana TaxID=64632 RepID=UPI0023004E09|nr:uncharacterized protein BDF20DRAFT_852683 [Mycotypha africana]KAI8987886.1 hypothetical protein BDF20DRAFT_852683 [Mycotypha africana]
MTTPHILSLPYDVIENISQHLDLCSNTSLMDTCRHMRYLYLSSQYIWRKIVLDPAQTTDLHRIYSSLRKLGDANGLKQLIYEVVMDGMDDADLSPIVMLIKFPNLRRLSARYRKKTTDLEVDVKLLQEMLKFGTIKPKSLPLTEVRVYHFNMDFEPHLTAYQKTLNKVSVFPKVKLDIRPCGFIQTVGNGSGSNLNPAVMNNDRQLQGENDQREQLSDLPQDSIEECQRIISKSEQCWSCGFLFRYCWICVPVCDSCKVRRVPPLANDKQRLSRSKQWVSVANDDDFKVFE